MSRQAGSPVKDNQLWHVVGRSTISLSALAAPDVVGRSILIDRPRAPLFTWSGTWSIETDHVTNITT